MTTNILYHAGLAPSIKEADMGTLESKYVLTVPGKRKCERFIEECEAKRKEILDAALDTCEDTFLPTIEDIESDINLLGPDEEDEYYNSWGVTDHYDSPPISLMLGIDFVESPTSIPTPSWAVPERWNLPWKTVRTNGDMGMLTLCRQCRHFICDDVCKVERDDLPDNVPERCPVLRWLRGEYE